jgi:hypothetical protein
MTVTINGTTGISTPGITNTGTETVATQVISPIIGSASGSSLSLQANGTTYATILGAGTNNGYFGINTTTPGYQLDLSGVSRLGNGVSQASPSSSNILSTAHTILNGTGGNYLTFGQDSSYNQWIQSSYQSPSTAVYNLVLQPLGGNVLVGTTNTDPVNNRVNGLAIAGTSGIDIRSATNVNLWGLNATSGNHIRFFTDNGSAAVAAGIISSSGSVTAYSVTSDYRLKQNVAPLQNGLKTISELKPCSYNYIAGNQYSEGFIAHELQAVVPHAVIGEKDAVDANGKPEYQAVDSSFLVPHLVAAIQELSAQVTTLQTQVTALQPKS